MSYDVFLVENCLGIEQFWFPVNLWFNVGIYCFLLIHVEYLLLDNLFFTGQQLARQLAEAEAKLKAKEDREMRTAAVRNANKREKTKQKRIESDRLIAEKCHKKPKCNAESANVPLKFMGKYETFDF